MAFDFGKWLPHIIAGGTAIAGTVIGSRAAGRASEISAEAAERNSQTQLQLSREQIGNLREIYNLDLSLQWPRHRLASESLGRLAYGSGSKLPMSAFETSEAPPELPGDGFNPGGGAPPPGVVDPLNPNTVDPIQVPPGGPPLRGGSVGSGARSGAATGAGIGSIVPGIGTAVGAGVGALAGAISGFFGGDQRLADYIVGPQNDLTERIGTVGSELSSRINNGTVTEEDWSNAATIIRGMRDQFYEFADESTGGPAGARQTIDAWVDPFLSALDQRSLNWADDWSTWEYDPNSVWTAPPPPPGQAPGHLVRLHLVRLLLGACLPVNSEVRLDRISLL